MIQAFVVLLLAVLTCHAAPPAGSFRQVQPPAGGAPATVPVGWHMIIGTNAVQSSATTISITNTITGSNPSAVIKVSNFSADGPTGVVCRATADGSFIALCPLLFKTNQFSASGFVTVFGLTNVSTAASVYFEAVWVSGVNEHGISGDVLTNCVALAVAAATYHADAAPVPGITNTISSTTVNEGFLDVLAVTSLTSSTFAPHPAGHTEKASVHRSNGVSQHRGGYMQGTVTTTVIGWDAVTADDGMTHVVIRATPP